MKKGTVKWADKADSGGIPLGSAHALVEVLPAANATVGCLINVHPLTGFTQQTHDVSIIRICPNAPYEREIVNTVTKLPFTPYFHSWGLSPNFAVLPIMKFTLDLLTVMEGKTLSQAFKPEDVANPDTTIYVVSTKTHGSIVECTLKNKHLYYTHGA